MYQKLQPRAGGGETEMTIKHCSVWSFLIPAGPRTRQFVKVSLYQIHDEVELYGEVNNEEHTGPAVLGVCWHHHIRETRKIKRWAWDKEKIHGSCDGRITTNIVSININITHHTVYFNIIIIIIAKRNHIFRELWKELGLTGSERLRSSVSELT